MTIHVVKEGETLQLISDQYQIPVERLILENGITNPYNLVVGQTVVIVYPLVTYTIQEGENLVDVANKNNVTVMQLLRNNPNLSDQNLLYPGETIVISYDSEKIRSMITNGYAYSFINRDILRKTLPFLTYLTVFNYRIIEGGGLVDIDDEEVLALANEYGVAPIMMISTISEQGTGNSEVSNSIIDLPEYQNNLINNVINTLKTKGYYGVNIYLQYLRPDNLTRTEEYIKVFSQRLHNEGLQLLVTVTPEFNIEGTTVSFESIDYSVIAQNVDGMLFLSYNWAYSFGPPASVTPYNIINQVLENVVLVVPPEKIFLGFPIIGYDWQLPYVPGETIARAINFDAAIELAALANVPIQYNEASEAPYFFYLNEMQELHIVWFKDSRSVNAVVGLITDYNLQGISIWNVMRFFAQMWFVINTQYNIARFDDSIIPFLNITGNNSSST